MYRKIRIFILVPNLEGGGSERVVSQIVNNIDRSKFTPTLVLAQKKGVYLKEIAKDVCIINLNKTRVRYIGLALIKLFRKEKPDIVLSTLGHLNLLIALIKPILPSKTVFIARESNTISERNKEENFPFLFNLLFRTVYKRYDRIICQCNFMKNDLIKNFGIPSEKLFVINNPVNIDEILNKSLVKKEILPPEVNNIVFIGRLSKQKRVDLLLKAFSIIKNTNSHLYIIGKGELREQLENIAIEEGIKDKITFLGERNNPFSLLAQANCLALTSAYEGFPNVVLEAHALGIPVVAFQSPGGIAEIIYENENGFLIPFGDIQAFSNGLLKAATHPFQPKVIQAHTRERYALPEIIAQYEEVLLNAIK